MRRLINVPVLPQKADIGWYGWYVRFGPVADTPHQFNRIIADARPRTDYRKNHIALPGRPGKNGVRFRKVTI